MKGPDRRWPIAAAAFLLSTAVARGAGPGDKLDNWLHLALDAITPEDLASFGETVHVGEDADLMRILVEVRTGTPPALLESQCACGLSITTVVPAPAPTEPDAVDLVTAEIPIVLLGSPSANRDPEQPLLRLAAIADVVSISASAQLAPALDISANNTITPDRGQGRNFLGANAQVLHPLGIDGTGVVVGIIDTGIDWEHDDFRTPGTRCTRIRYAWDQRRRLARCTFPAPISRECKFGAAGDAFCAGLRVCDPNPTGNPIPCIPGAAGDDDCKLKSGDPGSTCGFATGSMCLKLNEGQLPDGFTYGSQWIDEDFDYGLGCRANPGPGMFVPSLADSDGHGTAVAGIAAGDGSASGEPAPYPFEGIAPASTLVVVRDSGDAARVVDAADYVFKRANALGAPAVVNISAGTTGGPDVRNMLEGGLARLTGPGRLVVAVAGNSGQLAMHADNRAAPAPVGATQSLALKIAAGTRVVAIEIWHHRSDTYTCRVTGPNNLSLQVSPGQSLVSGGSTTSVRAANDVGGYPGHAGLPIMIQIVPDPTAAQAEMWVIELTRTGATGDGVWHALIVEPSQSAAAEFIVAPGRVSPTAGFKVESPGNADRIVSVAEHRTKHRPGTGAAADDPLGGIASASSPGPTLGGKRKPDISAPGAHIATSCSHDVLGFCSDTGTRTRCVQPDPCQPTGNCVEPCTADATHRYFSGTSAAAPHVTGCLALFLQQERMLTPQAALGQLIALSRTDALSVLVRRDANGDGRFAADEPREVAGHWNPDFGWGKLNCALKAEDFRDDRDILGGHGTFFSVRPGARGAQGSGVAAESQGANVYVGDRAHNGLAIHRRVFGLADTDNVDALSFKFDPAWAVPPPRFAGLEYSVDANSAGLPNTRLRAHAAGHRQNHVWIVPWPFAALGLFAPGDQFDLFSEIELALDPMDDVDAIDIENPLIQVADFGPNTLTGFPPFAAFPMTRQGPFGLGFDTFFSLDSTSLTPIPIGAGPADIFVSPGDGSIPRVAFRGVADLKLKAGDDIDGVFVDHLDFPYFSLAPGSPTLTPAGPHAADVLHVGPAGPAVFLPATALGLQRPGDDIDALDIEVCRFTALRHLTLKDDSVIETGAYVEVAEPRGWLRLAGNAQARDGTWLVAHELLLGSNSSVANVAADRVKAGRGVTIRGVRRATAPPLPLAVDASRRTSEECAGGQTIFVGEGETQGLLSGVYGAVRVAKGGVLHLAGGAYRFCDLQLGAGARLETHGDLPARIEVTGRLSFGEDSTVGPAAGTPVPTFEVGGRLVRLRGKSLVAHVRAPHARLSMGKGLLFRGSLLAASVRAFHSVKLGCAALGGP